MVSHMTNINELPCAEDTPYTRLVIAANKCQAAINKKVDLLIIAAVQPSTTVKVCERFNIITDGDVLEGWSKGFYRYGRN